MILQTGSLQRLFAEGAGAVELSNPDVLSNLQLANGCKLYLASSDIWQCYTRLRVPPNRVGAGWLRLHLVMPRVWSSEVGEDGPRSQLVPVLTALPMGIIPEVSTIILC